MRPSSPGGRCGITRRGFLAGAATGLAAGLGAGVPLTWLAAQHHRAGLAAVPSSPTPQATPDGMPGPFPGRVIEVLHPGSVTPDHRINGEAVQKMMDRGMTELTGAEHSVEAWRSFFNADDVVGIKVNPVGRRANPGEKGRLPLAVGAISSPEVLLSIVAGLKSAGVKPQNIIVFERYAREFIDAGYDKVMTERMMDGVRWYASAADYTNLQVDVEGWDVSRSDAPPELARHVAGYDPDVFVRMGFCSPEHDPKDDRSFRTHLSVIVTRMVNKIVTIPVLKDHRSAGVTLALKNLSHGMNNNVARSHISNLRHDMPGRPEAVSGPNQCNTFIPTAVGQAPTRQKATLHVLDGLIGVYEGGPGCWNKTWGTWHHKGLFFATDPVAMDVVGWNVIDAKRAALGWAPVASMGSAGWTPADTLRTRLSALADGSPADALALSFVGQNRLDGQASDAFDRRQPEHILLAGAQGLGVFDP